MENSPRQSNDDARDVPSTPTHRIRIDRFPLELLAKIFAFTNDYTIIRILSLVSKNFHIVSTFQCPTKKLHNFPPMIWTQILAYLDACSLASISQVSQNFSMLLKKTRYEPLLAALWRQPLNSPYLSNNHLLGQKFDIHPALMRTRQVCDTHPGDLDDIFKYFGNSLDCNASDPPTNKIQLKIALYSSQDYWELLFDPQFYVTSPHQEPVTVRQVLLGVQCMLSKPLDQTDDDHSRFRSLRAKVTHCPVGFRGWNEDQVGGLFYLDEGKPLTVLIRGSMYDEFPVIYMYGRMILK